MSSPAPAVDLAHAGLPPGIGCRHSAVPLHALPVPPLDCAIKCEWPATTTPLTFKVALGVDLSASMSSNGGLEAVRALCRGFDAFQKRLVESLSTQGHSIEIFVYGFSHNAFHLEDLSAVLASDAPQSPCKTNRPTAAQFRSLDAAAAHLRGLADSIDVLSSTNLQAAVVFGASALRSAYMAAEDRSRIACALFVASDGEATSGQGNPDRIATIDFEPLRALPPAEDGTTAEIPMWGNAICLGHDADPGFLQRMFKEEGWMSFAKTPEQIEDALEQSLGVCRHAKGLFSAKVEVRARDAAGETLAVRSFGYERGLVTSTRNSAIVSVAVGPMLSQLDEATNRLCDVADLELRLFAPNARGETVPLGTAVVRASAQAAETEAGDSLWHEVSKEADMLHRFFREIYSSGGRKEEVVDSIKRLRSCATTAGSSRLEAMATSFMDASQSIHAEEDNDEGVEEEEDATAATRVGNKRARSRQQLTSGSYVAALTQQMYA